MGMQGAGTIQLKQNSFLGGVIQERLSPTLYLKDVCVAKLGVADVASNLHRRCAYPRPTLLHLQMRKETRRVFIFDEPLTPTQTFSDPVTSAPKTYVEHGWYDKL
jgi:hypothetical protein